MPARISALCLLAAALAAAATLGAASDADPGKPSPYWSWDTIPVAFHGANKTGMYTDAAVAQLAKYSMVTLEKWYTPCASQGPTQGPPTCDVESKMFDTFRAIKQLDNSTTTIMYLNSMISFNFYALQGILAARERNGQHSWLRDRDGKVVSMCNDGNVYCNVTRFDWTQPDVLALWESELRNATLVGGVDGVFADHGTKELTPPDAPKLCDGKGAAAKCSYFTPEFAAQFNAKHKWLLNHTQDVLSSTTGGPVIDGPYARWHVEACDYHALSKAVEMGKQGTGPFVLEASTGACTAAAPGSEACLASFLCAMDKYTYLACFSSGTVLPEWYPAYDKPLGAPVSAAVEGPAGVFTRQFKSSAGITTAKIDTKTNQGTVHFAGDPPPPPPPPPLPASCGSLLANTGMGGAELTKVPATSYGACCDLCKAHAGCTIWCWHPEEAPSGVCHFHTDKAEQNSKSGVFSGRLPKA